MKKLATTLFLFILLCYLITAVTVLSTHKPTQTCTGIKITINDSTNTPTLTQADIHNTLKEAHLNPIGLPLDSINLAHIDTLLNQHPLIKHTTTYKTPGGHIHIHITPRHPILHIIPNNGHPYYIDSDGNTIPTTNLHTPLIVATGNITPHYAAHTLAPLANQIENDPFWHNQTQQINTLTNQQIELITRIGTHTIQLGTPNNIEEKLNKTKQFLTQTLRQTGWNKYKEINLEYHNQIICKKQ